MVTRSGATARSSAVARGALLAVLVLVLSGCWELEETFEGAEGDLGPDQEWTEAVTFGPLDERWEVKDGIALRTRENDPANSEVVALVEELPPSDTQEVSMTVHSLDLTQSEDTSWVSTGVLARASLEEGAAAKANAFSAYNAELVHTDLLFGIPGYILILWMADSWSYGDPPEDVIILAGEGLGQALEFPVNLTIRTIGTTISAIVVQDDGTQTRVDVADTTLEYGQVGMISSLITPMEGRVEVSDFVARHSVLGLAPPTEISPGLLTDIRRP